jgi:hypothetical protein
MNATLSRQTRIIELVETADLEGLNPNNMETLRKLYRYARNQFLVSPSTAQDYAALATGILRDPIRKALVLRRLRK